MKSVRPLVINDIRPYMVPNKVFTVRLFRTKSQRWLAGFLRKITFDENTCAISMDGYAQFGHHEDFDPTDVDSGLFDKLLIIAGSFKEDQRDFGFANPAVNDDNPQVLSFESPDGLAALSGRELEVKYLRDLLRYQPCVA